MEKKHFDGENKGDLKLFALSTCGWCKKTKQLLMDLKVAHDVIEVDLLNNDERKQAREEVTKHNPRCSFPTLVIDDKDCIVGYNEEKIREALGK